MASLLGHSHKKNQTKCAVFLGPNTGGSHGLPTLHDPGRGSHSQQHARARYGEEQQQEKPSAKSSENKHQKGILPCEV